MPKTLLQGLHKFRKVFFPRVWHCMTSQRVEFLIWALLPEKKRTHINPQRASFVNMLAISPSQNLPCLWFSSHNLCNNSRANYRLFLFKLSDPLREIILSECRWFIFHNACPCVLANMNYHRCFNRAACAFLMFASRKKITIIKSRARSRKRLRLATLISPSGKINFTHLNFCTHLHK